ncbi:hypothetical protein EK904_003227 [Melospiza melodia maxima]|nr:hypothetical protein EK904_003227 [Melospiza melodia maxima]
MRSLLLPLLVLCVPRLPGTLAQGEGCNHTAQAGLEGQDARGERGTLLNVSVSDHDRSDSLLLSWDEPEGGARGYFLALSPLGSGMLLQNGSAGPNTTSFWFHGLTPGTRYEIEVTATLACRDTTSQTITAQTSKGSQDLSAPSRGCCAVWSPSGLWEKQQQCLSMCHTGPSAVLNLTLSSSSSSSLCAAWAHGHGHRDGYSLALWHSHSQSLLRNVSLLPSTSTFLFEGLQAGSEYALKVSTLAGTLQASTSAHQWTAPSVPTQLRLSPASSTSLVASWAGAAGSAWLHLELHNLLTQKVSMSLSARRGLSSYTFQHLHPGTHYWLGLSASAGPYTALGPNATAWTYPLSPDNVTLSSAEEQNSLEARWSVPGGHRDFYLVTLQEGQDSAPSRNISVGGDNDHVTFHGLSPGQQYSVQVVAVAGPYRASAQSSAAWTEPRAPSAVSLSSQGSPHRLLASWEEASGEGYLLLLSLAEHPVHNSSLPRGARSFTYEGLHPGSLYSFEVSTVAGPYTSSPQCISNWTCECHSPRWWDRVFCPWYFLKVTVLAGPYRSSSHFATEWTYPVAPRNVYMTNQGYPNRLSASWRAEPQGQEGYRLLLYHSGSGTVAANVSVGKGTSKFTFSGLAPGHKYLLEVVSVAGPYAASAGNISDWTTPSVPQNLSAVAEGNSSMLISWGSVPGQQDECQLWLRDPQNSSLPWRHSLARGQGQHLLEGLIPGRNYSVSLSCVAGPYWSSTKPLAVPVALPPPLRAEVFPVEASSTVIISPELFSEENGQIEYYGVIATTNESLLRPTQKIMSSTWYDHYYGTEDSYLAVLLPNPFHQRSSPNTWRVPVGTEECGHSRATCNGKLKANEQYR